MCECLCSAGRCCAGGFGLFRGKLNGFLIWGVDSTPME
jgi:hypothetical protein